MNSTGFVQRRRGSGITIDFDDLYKARPEYVARLARWLGIQVAGFDHASVCRAVIRWCKRNPQPKPKNR